MIGVSIFAKGVWNIRYNRNVRFSVTDIARYHGVSKQIKDHAEPAYLQSYAV